MTKKEILKEISEEKPYAGANSMGCDERYYDWGYSIGKTFTKQELSKMTKTELGNLIRLANKLSEGLY